jgi:hypothetical protein
VRVHALEHGGIELAGPRPYRCSELQPCERDRHQQHQHDPQATMAAGLLVVEEIAAGWVRLSTEAKE